MKLYAIADLHMDGGAGKPMDVFGPHWAGHCGRIFGLWRDIVGEDDTVLIPGDISWAMHFNEALPDLYAISELPGNKVLLRGNHDYWWGSLSRMRETLPDNMKLIQNDALDMGPFIVCGSRGWLLPSDSDFSADDRRIYERELIRLGLSLSAAARLNEKAAQKGEREKPLIAMLHFPPALREGNPTGFTELMEKYRVSRCLYGHLHGSPAWMVGFKGELNGVKYDLCSADSLGFSPMLVEEFEEEDDKGTVLLSSDDSVEPEEETVLL